jgi:hypothetical protein
MQRTEADLLQIADPESDGYTLTRKDKAWKMLSLKVPYVTVYNLLAAFKDTAHCNGTHQIRGQAHTMEEENTTPFAETVAMGSSLGAHNCRRMGERYSHR